MKLPRYRYSGPVSLGGYDWRTLDHRTENRVESQRPTGCDRTLMRWSLLWDSTGQCLTGQSFPSRRFFTTAPASLEMGNGARFGIYTCMSCQHTSMTTFCGLVLPSLPVTPLLHPLDSNHVSSDVLVNVYELHLAPECRLTADFKVPSEKKLHGSSSNSSIAS